MSFSTDNIEEINILNRFNLDTTQEGIKIHSGATNEQSSAAEQLFNKGLISQVDGGYLTERGRIAAEHTQALAQLLK